MVNPNKTLYCLHFYFVLNIFILKYLRQLIRNTTSKICTKRIRDGNRRCVQHSKTPLYFVTIYEEKLLIKRYDEKHKRILKENTYVYPFFMNV